MIVKGSEDQDEVVIAELDLDEIREVRDGWQFFRDLRPDMYGDLSRTIFG
jgi:N-carbamoylputrescine amidase